MAIANAINAQTAGVQCMTSAGVWNGRTITAGTGISVTNGDGVSGNPTISATGMSGGSTNVVIYDDFICSQTASAGIMTSSIGWISAGGSSTNSLVFGTATADHPGVVLIRCNSGSAGAAGMTVGQGYTPETSRGIVLGGGVITYSTVVNLSVLGVLNQDYNCYVGLGDLTDAANEVTNGVYFHYTRLVNSGNWVGKTASGGSRNSVNSSVAASTNWVNLGFTVNAAASSVEFFINGVSIGTQASTIPTSDIGFFYQMDNISGANNKELSIDLVNYNQTLTNAR
jgi:hypothetical protein